MRNILYIFNSKKFPRAMLGSLAMIVIVEFILSNALPHEFFSHEIDKLLYYVEYKRYDSEVVLLGDSVGRQILSEDYIGKGDERQFAIIPANLAIEMTGQYFLVKRYLSRNKKPKAVIFIGRYPLAGNLKRPYTENYFQRCFLKFDEIAEVMLYKDIKFCFIMLIYRLFPSYRYRLSIQKQLAGSSNADLETGALNSIAGNTTEKIDMLEGHICKITKSSPISNMHMIKLLGLLKEKSIKFYFLTGPISETRFKVPRIRKCYDFMINYYNGLRDQYKDFYFSQDLAIYSDRYFKDDKVHLNEEGLELAAKELWSKIVEIQNEIRKEQ